MSLRSTRALRAPHFVPSLAGLLLAALASAFNGPAVAAPKGGGKNVAPVISGTPAASIVAGARYDFVPTATDANGDRLRFSIANKPSWAAFDAASGRVSGVPAATQVGTYGGIVVTVSDGRAKVSLPAFAIQVQPAAASTTPNRAPAISGVPASSTVVGQAYSFRPTASDPDGDRVTFAVANRPSWAAFDENTGALSGVPGSTDAGTYAAIVVTVSDGVLSASLPSFTVVVQPPNQPPTISGAPPASVVAGQTYSFAPRASDPEGRALTYSISNKPAWATFSTSTGLLAGTPSNADVGTYSNVSISASDGALTAALAPFAISVQPVPLAGSAELQWQAPVLHTDGTPLTTLAGYRIYYGTTRGTYPNRVDIPNAGITMALIERLAPATYYFVMTAYDSAGVESAFTAEVAKTVQ